MKQQRSIQSLNPNCVCVILNSVSTLLSETLLEPLRARVDEAPAKGILSLKPFFDTSSKTWGLLNSIDQIAENIPKLAASAKEQAARLFCGSTAAAALPKIASCIEDVENSGNKFRALLSRGFDAQYRQTAGLRVRQAAETLFAACPTYTLTPQEYGLLEAGDTAFAQFGAGIVGVATSLSTVLRPSLYDLLVNRLVGYAAEKTEALVFQRKFNKLGALQLDVDIRALQQRLTPLARTAVRERWTRLTQMALFLGADSVEDAGAMWNAGTTWRLAPAEMKRILALRADFDPSAVKRLALQ